MVTVNVSQQSGFEATDFRQFHIFEVTAFSSEQYQALLCYRHRGILFLFQQFGHFLTVAQLLTSRFVQIGCELRERSQFTILRQRGTDTTGQFLDDLGLSSTTNTGYGDTRVNRRTNTGVEQVGFQEDLTIGNGNYVGRNECGNVTRLRLDNRQRSQGAGFTFNFTIGELLNVFRVNAGCALQQTGVEVEHVARECFTSWRTTEQQET